MTFDVSTIKLSDLPSISFEDRKRLLPNSPGIYFVLGSDGAVLYVGRAKSILRRWKGRRFTSQAASIAWLIVRDLRLLSEVEVAAITHFNPSLNIKMVPRAVEVLSLPVLPDWVNETMAQAHRVLGSRPRENAAPILAQALRHFKALSIAEPAAYQIVKTYFVMLLESWSEPIPTSAKSLSGLVGEAAEKLNDLQRARFIDGGSDKVQREETLAVISALQQFLAGLGKQLELKAPTVRGQSNIREVR